MRWSVNLARESSQRTVAREIGFITERGERRERKTVGRGTVNLVCMWQDCVCGGKDVGKGLVSS